MRVIFIKPSPRMCEPPARGTPECSRAAASPVGLHLEPERIIAKRSNKRLVVSGYDHDARIGHRMPPPVFLGVVADKRAARYEHVPIDDRTTNAGVAPHPDSGHENALLDMAKAVY